MKTNLTRPVDLPVDLLIPTVEQMQFNSKLHGRLHIARVLTYGLKLIELLNIEKSAPMVWASIFLHDIARKDDGTDLNHGERAASLFYNSAELQSIINGAGIHDNLRMITDAVHAHSLSKEPWEIGMLESRNLIYILKDADALDRVRFSENHPSYLTVQRLKFSQSRKLIQFAKDLNFVTADRDHTDPNLNRRVWADAELVLSMGDY